MQVPAPFEYERATSVEEALELLTQLGPDARLLAGGHSLLPMMKLRLASPAYLIDIDPLADELGYISEHDGEVRIGAMTRHRALLESELLADRLAIFTDAERVIADPVVRNRGTIGGALCQADPSEDLSAVCAAIGAQMVIRGTGGERVLGMDEFHRGPYQTAVGPGRDARRDPRPAVRRLGQRVREGRPPGRRLGGGGGGGVDHAVAGRQRSPAPASPWPRSARRSPRARRRRRWWASLRRRSCSSGPRQRPPQACRPVTDQRGRRNTSGTSSAC